MKQFYVDSDSLENVEVVACKKRIAVNYLYDSFDGSLKELLINAATLTLFALSTVLLLFSALFPKNVVLIPGVLCFLLAGLMMLLLQADNKKTRKFFIFIFAMMSIRTIFSFFMMTPIPANSETMMIATTLSLFFSTLPVLYTCIYFATRRKRALKPTNALNNYHSNWFIFLFIMAQFAGVFNGLLFASLNSNILLSSTNILLSSTNFVFTGYLPIALTVVSLSYLLKSLAVGKYTDPDALAAADAKIDKRTNLVCFLLFLILLIFCLITGIIGFVKAMIGA